MFELSNRTLRSEASCASPDSRGRLSLRLQLLDLDRRGRHLEGDLVTAVAERLVGGGAASAKGKRCLARQIVLVAIGVEHFDNAVRIVYTQRTVFTHRYRDLRHETSSLQTIAPLKNLRVLSSQYPVKKLSRTGHGVRGTGYRQRYTPSHHNNFA